MRLRVLVKVLWWELLLLSGQRLVLPLEPPVSCRHARLPPGSWVVGGHLEQRRVLRSRRAGTIVVCE